MQALGMGLRVSCQHRVISSCLGCLGVGVSSAFTGHTSRYVHRQVGIVAWQHAPCMGTCRHALHLRSLRHDIALVRMESWMQFEKGGFKENYFAGFNSQDALLDAIVGVLCFKVGKPCW